MQWYLQRLRANVGRRAPHASGARDQRRPWRGAAGHASRSAAAQPKTDPKATPKMDGWRVACALAARTWAGRWYRAGYGARLAAAGGRDTVTVKLRDDTGPTWGEYQFTAVTAARR